jgi:phosphoglycolate phosphatase-like HAD superfamily hydrolase
VPGCVAGLLTGSTRATARIKLASAGIDFGLFACGAYSEDGELREELPPVAQDRFASLFACRPQVTIIVGDTPRDVQAALATGCAFIGVTTGHYGRAALESAGARTVLENLTAANFFLEAVSGLL